MQNLTVKLRVSFGPSNYKPKFVQLFPPPSDTANFFHKLDGRAPNAQTIEQIRDRTIRTNIMNDLAKKINLISFKN